MLEDPGGEPLDKLLGMPMELERFCCLAIAIAAALGRLHARGLVHKDIKPANILVHQVTGEVRLTGFGIASRLMRERQSPRSPETIAGTLAYMAPEQTGRVNRSIDSRSDLYALGITLTKCSSVLCRSTPLILWGGSIATSPKSQLAPAEQRRMFPAPFRQSSYEASR